MTKPNIQFPADLSLDDPGVQAIEKTTLLLAKLRKREASIVDIEAQEQQLREEVAKLEEEYEPGNEEAAKILSVRRTMLECCPGCVVREQKAIKIIESQLAETLPELRALAERLFSARYKTVLQKAVASMVSFFRSEAEAEFMAKQSHVVSVAGNLTRRADLILTGLDPVDSQAEQMLALFKE